MLKNPQNWKIMLGFNLFMSNKWVLYFLLYLLEMQTVMYEINLEANVSKVKFKFFCPGVE